MRKEKKEVLVCKYLSDALAAFESFGMKENDYGWEEEGFREATGPFVVTTWETWEKNHGGNYGVKIEGNVKIEGGLRRVIKYSEALSF